MQIHAALIPWITDSALNPFRSITVPTIFIIWWLDCLKFEDVAIVIPDCLDKHIIFIVLEGIVDEIVEVDCSLATGLVLVVFGLI